MNAIKMNRIELLNIVFANQEKHAADFIEAVADYKEAVLKITKQNLALARTGDLDKIAKIRAVPQKPVSYEKNYERAIRMLQLSVEDVIEVEEDVFNQLVLDEWAWKHNFVAAASLYKSL